MDQSFQSLLRMDMPLKKEAEGLLSMNETTAPHGLQLSQKEAEEVALTRREALDRCGRIEIGSDTVRKIAAAFCSSRFLTQANYVTVLEEATEAFYALKNESEDTVTDDELARLLADGFERCGGELEKFLGSRELDSLLRFRRYGYAEPQEEESKDEEEEDADE